MKKTFVYDQEGRVVEETTEQSEYDIRMQLLDMTKTANGLISPQTAFEAEHYVLTGKLMPYLQLKKARESSEARD
jgi:hypothetical protein